MASSVVQRSVFLLRPWTRRRSTTTGTIQADDSAATIAAPIASSRIRPWDEVPGPKPLPLLGNTWRFIPFIGDYSVSHVDKTCLSLRKQYGDCVRLAGLLGRPDMLFVFDADEVERVFRTEDALPHRPSMPSLDYYKHVLRKDFFGEKDCAGVIAVHGPAWQAFRNRVSRAVLDPRAIRQYAPAAAQAATALVLRSREIRDNNFEMPEDYINELHKWSLESLALVALDARLGCFDRDSSKNGDTQALIDAIQTFFLAVGELELKAPFWRLWMTPMYRRYINALDTIVNVTIRYVNAALKRTADQKTPDGTASSVLQRLLAAAGPKVATVAALDLFLVGVDTTSNAVASILYQLASHQRVQECLHREIKFHLPNPTDDPTPEILDKMQYLKACIKETLRMYPVVIGNGRQLTKDTAICGYNVPKGTQIIFQHYVMSNSEEYFTESSSFLPERWLKQSSARSEHLLDEESKEVCRRFNGSQRQHPFASLPFGYGKRMCLGRRFADLEMQTVICKMIQSFHLEYHHAPLDYHIHPMYTPNGPLKLKLIDR